MIKFGDLPRVNEASLQHRVSGALLCGRKGILQVDSYDNALGKWAVQRSAAGKKKIFDLHDGKIHDMESLDKYILEPSRKWHLSLYKRPFRIIQYYHGKRYSYGISRSNSRLITTNGDEEDIGTMLVAELVAAFTMPGYNSLEEVMGEEALNRYTNFYKDTYKLSIDKAKAVPKAVDDIIQVQPPVRRPFVDLRFEVE
jgi:hypothetical protein